jgi:hypothetical protein
LWLLAVEQSICTLLTKALNIAMLVEPKRINLHHGAVGPIDTLWMTFRGGLYVFVLNCLVSFIFGPIDTHPCEEFGFKSAGTDETHSNYQASR